MTSCLDIDKFIEENLEEIIENKNENYINYSENNKECKIELKEKELNEDEEDDDINESISNFYEQKIYEKPIEINEEDYYLSLLNTFLKYYNDKFDKKDNFFSENLKNIGSLETNPQMELFFESIIEFKNLENKIKFKNVIKENIIIGGENIAIGGIEKDYTCYLNYYYDSTDNNLNNDEILTFINDDNYEQLYCLELENKKIIAPSLIICLDYIVRNEIETKWSIYNLKNIN